ncbi:hypothetical protein B0H14DRAFT_2577559 [Mycena olivaceomarginata]|nr:hypothetical protein B0H14DRAFT_2577559 [Mycena olivaceomarginata]
MKGTATNLNAPAALGPNHIPTSFSAALLASAMRCTPNGTTGASRNYNRRRGCAVGVWEGNGGVGVGWRGDSVKRERISISDGVPTPRPHPREKKDKSSPVGSKSKEKKTRRRDEKSTPARKGQKRSTAILVEIAGPRRLLNLEDEDWEDGPRNLQLEKWVDLNANQKRDPDSVKGAHRGQRPGERRVPEVQPLVQLRNKALGHSISGQGSPLDCEWTAWIFYFPKIQIVGSAKRALQTCNRNHMPKNEYRIKGGRSTSTEPERFPINCVEAFCST